MRDSVGQTRLQACSVLVSEYRCIKHYAPSHGFTAWCIITKVKVPCNTPCSHRGGVKVQLHSFLNSALDVGEWLTPRSGRFTSEKKKARSPLYIRLVGPRGWSGRAYRTQNLLLLARFEPRTVQPEANCCTDCAMHISKGYLHYMKGESILIPTSVLLQVEK
jgi:hypothetical protein